MENKMENIKELVKMGMTEKYAEWWMRKMSKDRTSGAFKEDYIDWAHSLGFSCHAASVWNITEETLDQYITEYDFHRCWPINDWERIWVNDKITLRYMLCDKKYDSLMPKYYYYMDKQNGLVRLIDHPTFSSKSSPNCEELLSLLSSVGTLACKPNNSEMSTGFCKLVCLDENKYEINGQKASKKEIADFIENHPNYIFTEYLEPGAPFDGYDSRIPTIRIVTINSEKNKADVIGGVIRYASVSTGEGNYTQDFTSEDYLLYTDVDFNSGWFGNAKKVYFNHVEDIKNHPITGAIMEGYLPNISYLVDQTLDIADRFSLLECLGFDFGLTKDGYKLMEINSLPGGMGMQVYRPLMNNPVVKEFVLRKRDEVDKLTDEQKIVRSKLQR